MPRGTERGQHVLRFKDETGCLKRDPPGSRSTCIESNGEVWVLDNLNGPFFHSYQKSNIDGRSHLVVLTQVVLVRQIHEHFPKFPFRAGVGRHDP